MAETAQQALDLVAELSKKLNDRQADIKLWKGYYDGKQPLKYATEEYKVQFGEQYKDFRDNWCAPVADTTAEKLTPAGLQLGPREGKQRDTQSREDRQFARIWAENGGPETFSLAVTEATIARRAFAIVWGDGDGTDTPEISFETPDQVIVAYDKGSRRRRAALKQWTDGDRDFATLYTGDFLWKFQRPRLTSGNGGLILPASYTGAKWVERRENDEPWPLPNPTGVVPVIELPNRPRLRSEPLSEVAGVGAMQDAVNALWAYMFTAADFAAMPQRVILNALLPKVPILDGEGQPIPGAFKDASELIQPVLRRRIAAFQSGAGDGEVKIGQWDAAKLDVFQQVIEFAVGHIAAQSRTPVHYFVTGKISNISGDGLKAFSEAHTSKIRERSVYYGYAIKEIAAVAYLMLGKKKLAAAARAGTVKWQDFEARSEGAVADKLLKLKQIGFSFEYLARQIIADPVELADEIRRHNEEMALAAAMGEFGDKPEPDPALGDTEA